MQDWKKRVIHVCADPQRFLGMLSPEDRVAAQLDLIVFRMYCIEEIEGAARRVDPQLVRVPIAQDETPDDYVFAFNEAKQSASEYRLSFGWRQMIQAPVGIWRREDPGAT